MEPTSGFRNMAFELVVKSFEHHKIHARFQETQRAWMVTAFLTFTGLTYVGITAKGGGHLFDGFYPGIILAHFFVSLLFMISVAKVSGEFRRHFSRAENILLDVKGLFPKDDELVKVFRNVVLETAAFEDDLVKKRSRVVLLSNASVHAYLFSFISSCDIYILLVGLPWNIPSPCALLVAALWFCLASFLQVRYINYLEKTGTSIRNEVSNN